MWGKFDDDNCDYVSVKEVVNCEAYMLIFRKPDPIRNNEEQMKEVVSNINQYNSDIISTHSSHLSLKNKSSISVTKTHKSLSPYMRNKNNENLRNTRQINMTNNEKKDKEKERKKINLRIALIYIEKSKDFEINKKEKERKSRQYEKMCENLHFKMSKKKKA